MLNSLRLAFYLLLGMVLLAGCGRSQPWSLTDVHGHLPDLAFSLTSDTGRQVNARDYRGKIVMMYFGYTHCPDICPMTMARLAEVMQRLGTSAENVRILFVSVDPERDTPALLHAYVAAFDPRASGLTGTENAIEALAKRYRAAYEHQKADAHGSYDVTHGSAVYIFDRDGHARLLVSPSDTVDAVTHDVRRLLQLPS